MSVSCVISASSIDDKSLHAYLDKLSYTAFKCGTWLSHLRQSTQTNQWQLSYRQIASSLRICIRTAMRIVKQLVSVGLF